MFASNSSRAGESDCEFAHLQNDMSGKLLTVRISLQQVIDEVNKFPVLESHSSGDSYCVQESNPFRDGLYSVLGDMVDMLKEQVPEEAPESNGMSNSGKKRRRTGDESDGSGEKLDWEQVLAPQRQLQSDWESVINSEHARSHFGSEQKKSKLKMFNNSIWDQVSEERSAD